MSSLLVLSAVSVLLCILSLRLFHRDPVKHPVFGTVQSIIVSLEVLVCLLDPPNKHKLDGIGIGLTDQASSDVIDELNDVEVKKGGLEGRLVKWTMTKKVKLGAHNDPKEMTLQRVSRTLEKLFFFPVFSSVSSPIESSG